MRSRISYSICKSALSAVDEPDLQDVLDLCSSADILEEQFSKLTTLNEICVDYDPLLTVEIITALDHLYGAGGLAKRREEFESFCRRRSDRLSHIYSTQYAAQQSPLLYQPASLAIFHLLELDRFRLREEWVKHRPVEELEVLAIMWGTPFAT